MSDKIKSRFILWDTGTDGNNGRVIPAHFTPTEYVPAQVAAEGTDKVSAHLKGIDNFLATITPENIINVKKNPGPGEFSSVKAAIDSITTASAVNPFKVKVGPGVYDEDPFTMKQFVLVDGEFDGATILQTNDPSVPFITGAPRSILRAVRIQAANDPGVPVVQMASTVDTFDPFILYECEFSAGDLLVELLGTANKGVLRVDQSRLDADTDYTTAFRVARDSGAAETELVLFNVISQKRGGAAIHFAEAEGDVKLLVKDVLHRVDTGLGHGVHASNGALIQIINSVFDGFDSGIHVLNVGAPCIFRAAGTIILNSTTWDLLIEHPGTIGAYNGAADISKVSIDPASSVTLSSFSLDGGGAAFTGPLYLGRRQEDLVDALDLIESSPTMGVIEGGALTEGVGFDVNVAAGFGYWMSGAFPDHILQRKDWTATSITLAANQDVYVYFNSLGILTAAASFPVTQTVILLGRVVTDSSGILFIDPTPMNMHHNGNKLDRALRFGFGPIFDSGSIVSENVTPLKLDITAGDYYFSANRIQPTGGLAITFTPVYRDGLSGYTFATPTDTVDNVNWDDGSGTLAPLTAGYYTKHTLYIAGAGVDQKFYLLYGQAEYSAQASAVTGTEPTPPPSFKDAVVQVSAIIVQEGMTNVDTFLDTRPTLAFRSGALASVSDHGNLSGLADDDHPQYLLVNGARPMAGSLDMGGNNITNVNLVDGVDVSAHAARHLPNGADPLTTAAAVGVLPNNVNGIGVANSLARSDHAHALPTAAAIAQAPDQANAVGTANTAARSDHVHNVPTAAAVGLDANSTNTQGAAATFARSNHTHAIATGVVSTQTPDQANAAGTSANVARADHVHNIPTATAVSIGTANGAGAAATFAKSDHVHQGVHGVRANAGAYRFGDLTLQEGSGVSVTDNGSGTFTFETVGGANELRVTYVSALDIAFTAGKVRINDTFYGVLAGTLTLTPSVADGRIYVDLTGTVVASLTTTIPANAVALASYTTDGASVTALADIRVFLNNNVVFGTSASQVQAGVAAAGGTSDTFSRANHVHNIATGAASGQTPDQANAEGVSANVARADHVHNIPTAAAISVLPNNVNGAGVAATFAKSDHAHALATAAPTALAAGTANTIGTANSVSRSDHIHNVPTAAGVTLDGDSTNTEGAGANFSRATHTHAITTAAAITQTPDNANAAGTAAGLSRADHVHNIPTAAAVTLDATSTNTQGAAATFARSNHTHAITTAIAVTLTPDAANAIGTAAGLSRADHVHNVPTAAAVTLDANSTNTQGAAATFARSNHTHAITSAAAVTQTPDQANAAGTAAGVARADHVHNIPTAAATGITTSSTNTQGAAATFAKSDHTHAVSLTQQRTNAAAGASSNQVTDTLVTGMTQTPPAGVYWVVFTSSVVNSGNGAQRTFASVYFNGAQQTNTEISAGTAGGAYAPITVQGLVTADGTNAIEIRARVAAGTSTWGAMTLQLIRISN